MTKTTKTVQKICKSWKLRKSWEKAEKKLRKIDKKLRKIDKKLRKTELKLSKNWETEDNWAKNEPKLSQNYAKVESHLTKTEQNWVKTYFLGICLLNLQTGALLKEVEWKKLRDSPLVVFWISPPAALKWVEADGL